MNIVIGVLVIFTHSPEEQSSKRNAKQQMFVIMSGMLITFSNSAFTK
jgi:hypothetical protein